MTASDPCYRPLLDVLEVFFQAFETMTELHGWAILKSTKRSGPTVYGVLDRLEDAGWINGRWEDQEPGPASRGADSTRLHRQGISARVKFLVSAARRRSGARTGTNTCIARLASPPAARRCHTNAVIVVSIIFGVVVNELWNLARGARARSFNGPLPSLRRSGSRGARAEEFCALIDDRPGNLFKLFTAFSFAIATITVLARRPQEHSTRLRANLTPIQLTPQQVKAVHDESIRHALTLGMSHEKAELMADAVVGALIDTD